MNHSVAAVQCHSCCRRPRVSASRAAQEDQTVRVSSVSKLTSPKAFETLRIASHIAHQRCPSNPLWKQPLSHCRRSACSASAPGLEGHTAFAWQPSTGTCGPQSAIGSKRLRMHQSHELHVILPCAGWLPSSLPCPPKHSRSEHPHVPCSPRYDKHDLWQQVQLSNHPARSGKRHFDVWSLPE